MTAFVMERLDFRLPDFTRYLWVSDQARETWQPRIQRIVTCWQDIAWRATSIGILPCIVQIIPSDQLAVLTERASHEGLSVVPLDKIRTQDSYTTLLVEAQGAEPFQYRIGIGHADQIERLQVAWEHNDQAVVRSQLGYPPCCRDFFEEVWIKARFLDTTWPMACNTPARKEHSAQACEVEGSALSNILLRWLGIRAVPHLPCSFQCSATVELGEQLLASGLRAGFTSEMEWLREMLDWPMEWSALHGIAEIKTPVVKIATLTDATAQKYVVRHRGRTYPAEAPRGLTFPYRAPIHLRITDSPSFQRGLAHPIEDAGK